MEKTKRSHHKEKVSLSSESLGKIERMISSLTDQLKGSKISRSDLVNWIVEKRREELLALEISDLVSRYYCPVKALDWAYKKAREAKHSGESIDLSLLLDEIKTPVKRKKNKS